MKQKIFYGWIIAAAGFLLSFFGIGARYSFGVFIKSIEVEFDITRTSASGIFSIYMLLCVFFAVVGGWAIDRYGPRKIGIIMGIFTGLSLLITSMVSEPWQLLISYSLLLSLGTGAMYGVVNTTTSRWFVKKRGFVIGITSSGGGVGAIILAPFATYLISNYSWRTAFIVVGIISLILMIFSALWLVKDPGDMGLSPDNEVPEKTPEVNSPTDNSDNNVSKLKASNGIPDFTTAQALRMNQYWLLFLSWVFLSLSIHMIYIHVVPYAIDSGITPLDAAFILSLLGIANITGRLSLGKLSDTIGRKKMAVICGVIHSASLLWLMQSDQLWMMYIFAVVFGLLWGGSGTMITSLIGDTFGTGNLGPIMGSITAGWALGAALGPAIGGYIFDTTGLYFYAFGAGATALLASAFFIAFLKPATQ